RKGRSIQVDWKAGAGVAEAIIHNGRNNPARAAAVKIETVLVPVESVVRNDRREIARAGVVDPNALCGVAHQRVLKICGVALQVYSGPIPRQRLLGAARTDAI